MLLKTLSRAILFAALLIPSLAFAQTDEIQVYDASIAEQGHVDVTLHNNFTPNGIKTPRFPGATISNQSFNGTLETAYGAAPWLELGLYLPLYSIANDGPQFNGGKLRALFVVPDAKSQTFFYGVNFELSDSNKHWEQRSPSLEIRPILGLHLGKWDLIYNPIIDSDFTGVEKAEFNPAARIAYNINDTYALGVEHFAGFGTVQSPTLKNSYEEVFVVGDYTLDDANSFEFGTGFGLNKSSDAMILKLIVNHSF